MLFYWWYILVALLIHCNDAIQFVKISSTERTLMNKSIKLSPVVVDFAEDTSNIVIDLWILCETGDISIPQETVLALSTSLLIIQKDKCSLKARLNAEKIQVLFNSLTYNPPRNCYLDNNIFLPAPCGPHKDAMDTITYFIIPSDAHNDDFTKDTIHSLTVAPEKTIQHIKRIYISSMDDKLDFKAQTPRKIADTGTVDTNAPPPSFSFVLPSNLSIVHEGDTIQLAPVRLWGPDIHIRLTLSTTLGRLNLIGSALDITANLNPTTLSFEMILEGNLSTINEMLSWPSLLFYTPLQRSHGHELFRCSIHINSNVYEETRAFFVSSPYQSILLTIAIRHLSVKQGQIANLYGISVSQDRPTSPAWMYPLTVEPKIRVVARTKHGFLSLQRNYGLLVGLSNSTNNSSKKLRELKMTGNVDNLNAAFDNLAYEAQTDLHSLSDYIEFTAELMDGNTIIQSGTIEVNIIKQRTSSPFTVLNNKYVVDDEAQITCHENGFVFLHNITIVNEILGWKSQRKIANVTLTVMSGFLLLKHAFLQHNRSKTSDYLMSYHIAMANITQINSAIQNIVYIPQENIYGSDQLSIRIAEVTQHSDSMSAKKNPVAIIPIYIIQNIRLPLIVWQSTGTNSSFELLRSDGIHHVPNFSLEEPSRKRVFGINDDIRTNEQLLVVTIQIDHGEIWVGSQTEMTKLELNQSFPNRLVLNGTRASLNRLFDSIWFKPGPMLIVDKMSRIEIQVEAALENAYLMMGLMPPKLPNMDSAKSTGELRLQLSIDKTLPHNSPANLELITHRIKTQEDTQLPLYDVVLVPQYKFTESRLDLKIKVTHGSTFLMPDNSPPSLNRVSSDHTPQQLHLFGNTYEDLQLKIRKLVYKPPPNFNGWDLVTFQLNSLESISLRIYVVPVEDPLVFRLLNDTVKAQTSWPIKFPFIEIVDVDDIAMIKFSVQLSNSSIQLVIDQMDPTFDGVIVDLSDMTHIMLSSSAARLNTLLHSDWAYILPEERDVERIEANLCVTGQSEAYCETVVINVYSPVCVFFSTEQHFPSTVNVGSSLTLPRTVVREKCAVNADERLILQIKSTSDGFVILNNDVCMEEFIVESKENIIAIGQIVCLNKALSIAKYYSTALPLTSSTEIELKLYNSFGQLLDFKNLTITVLKLKPPITISFTEQTERVFECIPKVSYTELSTFGRIQILQDNIIPGNGDKIQMLQLNLSCTNCILQYEVLMIADLSYENSQSPSTFMSFLGNSNALMQIYDSLQFSILPTHMLKKLNGTANVNVTLAIPNFGEWSVSDSIRISYQLLYPLPEWDIQKTEIQVFDADSSACMEEISIILSEEFSIYPIEYTLQILCVKGGGNVQIKNNAIDLNEAICSSLDNKIDFRGSVYRINNFLKTTCIYPDRDQSLGRIELSLSLSVVGNETRQSTSLIHFLYKPHIKITFSLKNKQIIEVNEQEVIRIGNIVQLNWNELNKGYSFLYRLSASAIKGSLTIPMDVCCLQVDTDTTSGRIVAIGSFKHLREAVNSMEYQCREKFVNNDEVFLGLQIESNTNHIEPNIAHISLGNVTFPIQIHSINHEPKVYPINSNFSLFNQIISTTAIEIVDEDVIMNNGLLWSIFNLELSSETGTFLLCNLYTTCSDSNLSAITELFLNESVQKTSFHGTLARVNKYLSRIFYKPITSHLTICNEDHRIRVTICDNGHGKGGWISAATTTYIQIQSDFCNVNWETRKPNLNLNDPQTQFVPLTNQMIISGLTILENDDASLRRLGESWQLAVTACHIMSPEVQRIELIVPRQSHITNIEIMLNTYAGNIVGTFVLQIGSVEGDIESMQAGIIHGNAVAMAIDERDGEEHNGRGQNESVESIIRRMLKYSHAIQYLHVVKERYFNDQQNTNYWKISLSTRCNCISYVNILSNNVLRSTSLTAKLKPEARKARLYGQFSLRIGNEVTPTLPIDINEIDLQSTLDQLPSIEVSKVVQTKPYNWDITFMRPSTSVPLLEANGKIFTPFRSSSYGVHYGSHIESELEIKVERTSIGVGQGSWYAVMLGARRLSPIYQLLLSFDQSVSGTFQLGLRELGLDEIESEKMPVVAVTNEVSPYAPGCRSKVARNYQLNFPNTKYGMEALESVLTDAVRRVPARYHGENIMVEVSKSSNPNGYIWLITFRNSPPNFPELAIVNSRLLRGKNVLLTLTCLQYPNFLGGSFVLKYRDQTTIDIPANATATYIESALSMIGHFSQETTSSVIVRKSLAFFKSEEKFGYRYDILFTKEESMAGAGINEVDGMPLLAADGRMLTGIGAFASVQVLYQVPYKNIAKFNFVGLRAMPYLSSSRNPSRWMQHGLTVYTSGSYATLTGNLISLRRVLDQIVYTALPGWDYGAVYLDIVLMDNSLTAASRKQTSLVDIPRHNKGLRQIELAQHLAERDAEIVLSGNRTLPLDSFKFAPSFSSIANWWFNVKIVCDSGYFASQKMLQEKTTNSLWLNGTLKGVNIRFSDAYYIQSAQSGKFDHLRFLVYYQNDLVFSSNYLVKLPTEPVLPYIHYRFWQQDLTHSNEQSMINLDVTEGKRTQVSGIYLHTDYVLPSESIYFLTIFAKHGLIELAPTNNVAISSSSVEDPLNKKYELHIVGNLYELNHALTGLYYTSTQDNAIWDYISCTVTHASPMENTTQKHERKVNVFIQHKVNLPRVSFDNSLYYGHEDTPFQFPENEIHLPEDNVGHIINANIHGKRRSQLWSTDLIRPDVDAKHQSIPVMRQRAHIYDFPIRLPSSVFATHGTYFYFAGGDLSHGIELWRSDGTAFGTSMVLDINPGKEGSFPSDFTVANNLIYFAASGIDLSWILEMDKCQGVRKSSVNKNIMFVAAKDNLWNPSVIYECPPGYTWASSSELHEVNYSCDDQVATAGNCNSTKVEYTYWNQCGWSGYEYGGKIRKYFRFSDSMKTGMFKHAGRDELSAPQVNFDKVYFAGIVCISLESKHKKASYPNLGREVWISDGTKENTKRLLDLEAGPAGSSPRYFTPFQTQWVVFQAWTREFGTEMYKSDGTSDGTTLIADIWPGSRSSDPGFFTEWKEGDGRIYFSATNGNGRELWTTNTLPGRANKFGNENSKSNELRSGTFMVKDICPGIESSNPKFIIEAGALGIAFSATDCVHGRELWISDSTLSGTRMVKDLNISPGKGSEPSYLAFFNGKIYFQAIVDPYVGAELYLSDGTAKGTQLLFDLSPGSVGSRPHLITAVNQYGEASGLYFATVEENSTNMLWKYDGKSFERLWGGQFSLYSKLSWDADSADIGNNIRLYEFNNVLYFMIDVVESIGHILQRNPMANSEELYQLHVAVTIGSIYIPLEYSKWGNVTISNSVLMEGSSRTLCDYFKRLVYYPPANWNSNSVRHHNTVEWNFTISKIASKISQSNFASSTYVNLVLLAHPDPPIISFPCNSDLTNSNQESTDKYSTLDPRQCRPIECVEDVPCNLPNISVHSLDLIEENDFAVFDQSAILKITASVSHGSLYAPYARCATIFQSLPNRIIFYGDSICLSKVFQSWEYLNEHDYTGADSLKIIAEQFPDHEQKISISIVIGEINDAPYFLSETFYECDEDSPTRLENLEIVDPDAEAGETIQIEIKVLHGEVSFLNVDGIGLIRSEIELEYSCVLMMSGDIHSLNVAISTFIYTSGENWNSLLDNQDSSHDGFDTITINLSDTNDINATSTSELYIFVNPKPDPVEITLPTNDKSSPYYRKTLGQLYGAEDSNLIIYGIEFACPDATSMSMLTVTLSVQYGQLEHPLYTPGVSVETNAVKSKVDYSGVEHILSSYLKLRGTYSYVNIAIRKLKYHARPNFSGQDVLTIIAAAIDEYTSQPSIETNEKVFVDIEPINDAPKWSIPNAVVNVKIGAPTYLLGISFEDVDANSEACKQMPTNISTDECEMELMVETQNLRIKLPYWNAKDFFSYFVVTGTPAFLNHILSKVIVLTPDPIADQNSVLDWDAHTQVTQLSELLLTIDDKGIEGRGGPHISKASIVLKSSTPDSHSLSLSVPHNMLYINEDESVYFTSKDIKIRDENLELLNFQSFPVLYEIDIQSHHGRMWFARSDTLQILHNISVIENGVFSLRMRGYLSVINTALNCSAFTPTPNYFGPDQIDIHVKRLSNLEQSMEVMESLFLYINPVCDEPIWISHQELYSIDEGSRLLINNVSLVDNDYIKNDVLHYGSDIIVDIAVRHGGVMLATLDKIELLDQKIVNFNQTYKAYETGQSDISTPGIFFQHLTIQGSVLSINSAINGMIYEPAIKYCTVGSTYVDEIELTARGKCDEQNLNALQLSAVVEPVEGTPILESHTFSRIPDDWEWNPAHMERWSTTHFSSCSYIISVNQWHEIYDPIAITNPKNVCFKDSDARVTMELLCINCRLEFTKSMQILETDFAVMFIPTDSGDEKNENDDEIPFKIKVYGEVSAINRGLLSPQSIRLLAKESREGIASLIVSLSISNAYEKLLGNNKRSVYVRSYCVRSIDQGPSIKIPAYGVSTPTLRVHENSSIIIEGAPALQRNIKTNHKHSTKTNTNLLHVQPFIKANKESFTPLVNTSNIIATSQIINYQNRLVFAAEGPNTGVELWQSDGTQAGTSILLDLNPGTSGSSPTYFTYFPIDDRLYFAASAPYLTWRLIPERRDKCNSFKQSSFDKSVYFVVAEDTVWRPHEIYDCPAGFYWMPTAEAETVFIGRAANSSHKNEPLTYFNTCGWTGYDWGQERRVHFRFSDSKITGAYKHAGRRDSYHIDLGFQIDEFAGIVCRKRDQTKYWENTWSNEVWSTDGTAQGTYRVTQINVATSTDDFKSTKEGSNPSSFVYFGNHIYFQATSKDQGTELWATDGTRNPDATRLVADIMPGVRSSNPADMTVFNDVLLFSAFTETYGREMWLSSGISKKYSANGEHIGTSMLHDICAGESSSNPTSFAILQLESQAWLFFQADDCIHGPELWKTDGSSSGTTLVADIHKGLVGSVPCYLTTFRNKVYFQANDGIHGAELWESDGTAIGTKLVSDLLPGVRSSLPSFLTALPLGELNEVLLFAANSDRYEQTELWFSATGTNLTTQKLFPEMGKIIVINSNEMNKMHHRKFVSLSPHGFVYLGGVYSRESYQNLDNDDHNVLEEQDRQRSVTLVKSSSSEILQHEDIKLVLNCSMGSFSINLHNRIYEKFKQLKNSAWLPQESIIISGTIDELNYVLEQVTYHAPNVVGNVEYSIWDTIQITVSDLETNRWSTSNISVEIIAVNNAPVIDFNSINARIKAPINVWTGIESVAPIITDTDAGTALLYLECYVYHGMLSVASNIVSFLNVDILNHNINEIEREYGGARILEVAGTAEELTAFIHYIEYQCSDTISRCRPGESDELIFQVDDNGFTGVGGRQITKAILSLDII